MARLRGVPPEGLIGGDTGELWQADDASAMRIFLAELRAGPGASATIACRIRQVDGSWCWMEIVATNLLEEPAVAGIGLNARAIQDRTTAEQALTRKRDLLHLLMDSLPDPVFFKDAQSRFVRINRSDTKIPSTIDDSRRAIPCSGGHFALCFSWSSSPQV